MKRFTARAAAGFTRIELLAVLTLAAILFPASFDGQYASGNNNRTTP
jgi:hypothetical protein